MAHHRPPGPVSEPQYELLVTVGRCLHMPDFKSCHSAKTMLPRRIKINKRTSHTSVNQVLWFEPSLTSVDDHNWYGNVTFLIDLNELVRRFGENFYYIDKQEFPTHTASRVALSKRSLGLDKVDLCDGSPIKKYSGSGSWHHATTCKSSLYGTTVPHKLEVAIEVDTSDCKWIFDHAKVEPNNHSLANTQIGFGTRTCHRENTFGRHCSNALTREEARKKLEEECPGYNNA